MVFSSLRRLSCDCLQRSEADRNSSALNTSSPNKPHCNPEVVYQAEIYRIIYKETNGATFASLEVYMRDQGGQVRHKGRMDFFIRAKETWAIEALIDESDLVEHYSRFVGSGKYTHANLDDYIVLNFTKTKPKRFYRTYTQLQDNSVLTYVP